MFDVLKTYVNDPWASLYATKVVFDLIIYRNQ